MPRHKNIKFHQLKRPKVRQTWSKYNLFNLSRASTPPAANKTFFQQKWMARGLTRGYHHPYVKEKHWEKQFDRRLPAVVEMDYKYLAKYNGSEQALGRGGGLDRGGQEVTGDGRGGRQRKPKTPYMHMTFHPLERRLDTAIFRALFASSTKQARQFVVHGAVKVNGKRMIHPGYKLNPGDLFQVDPEKVMFATGAGKVKKDSVLSRRDIEDEKERKKLERKKAEEQGREDEVAAAESEPNIAPEHEEDPKKSLQLLSARATRILDSKRELSGKRRQDLREFSRNVRRTLSKLRGIEEDQVSDTIESLETNLAEILTKIPQDDLPKDESAALDSSLAAEAQDIATENQPQAASSNPQMADPSKTDTVRARKDAELLHAALARARENPIDSLKPYATPWRPREYMSAFAFIPRYLEVNQNICSAVYLRHPVARPGLAEVPTPFAGETLGLVFNWYLRRR